jgi:hypothetical protein
MRATLELHSSEGQLVIKFITIKHQSYLVSKLSIPLCSREINICIINSRKTTTSGTLYCSEMFGPWANIQLTL